MSGAMWLSRAQGLVGALIFVTFAVVFPLAGWGEWLWRELAIGLVAMLLVAACFPVYFGLKEPPQHD